MIETPDGPWGCGVSEPALRSDGRVEFYVNRRKLFVYLAGTSTITLFCFIPILKPMPTTRGMTAGTILIVIFGLISAYLTRDLLRSGRPALIFTSRGFWYAKASAETVPWGAVREVKPISTSRGKSLQILVGPQAAEYSTASRLLDWFAHRSAKRRDRVVLPLQLLDDPSGRIPQIVAMQVNASRALQGFAPGLSPEDLQAQFKDNARPKRTLPWLTLGLCLATFIKFANRYTGHFAVSGLLLGAVLGSLFFAWLYWMLHRGSAKTPPNAEEQQKMRTVFWPVMAAVCFVVIPAMTAFSFRW